MSSTFGQRICFSLVLLSVFYASGCVVFIYLEREAELLSYAENRELYLKMRELWSFHHCEDPAFKSLPFCKEQHAFSESLLAYFNQHGNSIDDRQQWSILGTLFFLTHLSTTIGYGNSHPRTPGGQLATIFFALTGIPIMGYVLAQVARLDLRVTVLLLEKLGARVNTVRRQIFVLWCLLVVFLFGGAFVYSCLEPWTYLQSLYFCFVTLSTVGFGDFLPSSTASRAFSILYMIFGLGVCASIIALLTGLVAESHDTVDTFLAQKLREDCAEGPCLKRGQQQEACPEASAQRPPQGGF